MTEKNPKLCLHCGADEVPRTALSTVVLPPETETYKPVGHDTFLDLVEDKIGNYGFRFGNQAHALTKDGERYFGIINLLNGTDSTEHALTLGVRNSLDKRFPAGISIGAHVFVCDNLSFTGDNVLKRRHTKNIMRDLPEMIDTAVSQTKVMREAQEVRFDYYRSLRIGDTVAHHLIVEAFRAGAMTMGRISRVINEWHHPSYNHGDKTVWRLYNAFTENFKGLALASIPAASLGVQYVLDDYVNYDQSAQRLPLEVA